MVAIRIAALTHAARRTLIVLLALCGAAGPVRSTGS